MSESEEVVEFYIPPASTACTETFFLFISDYKISIDAFWFTLNLAHTVDSNSVRAAKTLISSTNYDESEKERFQRTIDNPNRASKQLQKFSEVNSKSIMMATAEGFLWYMSNIIQNAMRRRPETIRSSETIKIDEIFNYSSKRELINFLIDRKINSLSYGGLRQIEKYLDETLGVALFREGRDKSLLRVFVEIRNIHAHNRGFVNKIFLDRAGDYLSNLGLDYKEGQKIHLGYDSLCLYSKACIETALHLDREVSKKFGIERKRISTWLKN